MSTSSSEDEMNEALKESANCDYINDLVNPLKAAENQTRPIRKTVSSKSSQDKIVKTNDFEQFLAHRLTERLDENIKIVERKPKEVGKAESTNRGIRLFSGSPVVSELKEDVDIEPRKKRKMSTGPVVDYDGRAEAVAVTPNWVKDDLNTAHWKDPKKPRVLNASVIKKHANGAIECSPIV